MGESITTRLDVPYNQHPDTRAKAVRALIQRGATDIIEILGLAEPATPAPAAAPSAEPRPTCDICNNPLPKLGICRRSQLCREKAPSLAEAKRRAARP